MKNKYNINQVLIFFLISKRIEIHALPKPKAQSPSKTDQTQTPYNDHWESYY